MPQKSVGYILLAMQVMNLMQDSIIHIFAIAIFITANDKKRKQSYIGYKSVLYLF